MKHVLLTGVTGFLGGHLAAELARAGVRVTGTGRNAERGRILQERLGITFFQDDLADTPRLPEMLQGADTIIHASALSAPWGRAAEFDRCNVLATDRLVTAAVEASRAAGQGLRLIHISTPSLYFRYSSGWRVPETAALPAPVNQYVRTKRMAEERLRAVGDTGLEWVILRPRALIGAGDSSILPRLAAAMADRRLPMLGKGQTCTDLTGVENVVQAVLLAARAPSTVVHTRTYNVSNGEPVLLWDLLREVASQLNLPPPHFRLGRSPAMLLAWLSEAAALVTGNEPRFTRYGVSVLTDTQTLDITAAKQDLGYQPVVPLARSLASWVKWYQSGSPYPFFE